MLLVSCSTNDVTEIDNSRFMRCAPEGAILINTIKPIGNDASTWIELKFRNECYLALGLCGYTGIFTKIDCEVKK